MAEPIKYLYHSSTGKEIWLAFDPNFPCIYCDEPVEAMSMGGPAVCGRCDCGRNKDGSKWGGREAARLYRHAWSRLDALATPTQQAPEGT